MEKRVELAQLAEDILRQYPQQSENLNRIYIAERARPLKRGMRISEFLQNIIVPMQKFSEQLSSARACRQAEPKRASFFGFTAAIGRTVITTQLKADAAYYFDEKFQGTTSKSYQHKGMLVIHVHENSKGSLDEAYKTLTGKSWCAVSKKMNPQNRQAVLQVTVNDLTALQAEMSAPKQVARP